MSARGLSIYEVAEMLTHVHPLEDGLHAGLGATLMTTDCPGRRLGARPQARSVTYALGVTYGVLKNSISRSPNSGYGTDLRYSVGAGQHPPRAQSPFA